MLEQYIPEHNEVTEFHNLILSLKSTSSKNKKVELIKDSYKKYPEISEMLRYSYDPMITFGVRNVMSDELVIKSPYFVPKWETIKESINLLKDRKITGNDAVNVASRLCNLCKWTNWVSLMLKKDLDCGISIKTINKAIPGCISEFNISLCEIADMNNIPEGWIMQEKLDGVRNISIVNPVNETVIHYSRTGKEVTAFNGVFDKNLLTIVKTHFHNIPIVFDGEVKGSTWNQTMNAKASVNENKEAKKALKYYIFNYMSMDQFVNKSVDNIEMDIMVDLKRIIENNYDNIEYPKTNVYYSYDELLTFYDDIVNNGGEGVILKNPSSVYKFKKSKEWLKMKPKDTYDGVIVEVKSHSKDSDQLGSVFVKGEYDNKPFSVWVGSGFTEEQRIEWWTNKDSLIGKTIEIEANEFIVGKDGNSLRFPRCKCIRLDK